MVFSSRLSWPTAPTASMKVPPEPTCSTSSPPLRSQETAALTRSGDAPNREATWSGVRKWWYRGLAGS